jgi:hypothetical protein
LLLSEQYWALTRLGVTVVSTVEVEENFTSLGLSNFAISFLSDDIIRLRYISINGQLRKMLMLLKMRGSAHSIDMWEYTITDRGVIIGKPLRGYRGLTAGVPGPWSATSGKPNSELVTTRKSLPNRKSPMTDPAKAALIAPLARVGVKHGGVEHIADSPQTALQKLAELALRICRADSAGISLILEQTRRLLLAGRSRANGSRTSAAGRRATSDPVQLSLIRSNAAQLFSVPSGTTPI